MCIQQPNNKAGTRKRILQGTPKGMCVVGSHAENVRVREPSQTLCFSLVRVIGCLSSLLFSMNLIQLPFIIDELLITAYTCSPITSPHGLHAVLRLRETMEVTYSPGPNYKFLGEQILLVPPGVDEDDSGDIGFLLGAVLSQGGIQQIIYHSPPAKMCCTIHKSAHRHYFHNNYRHPIYLIDSVGKIMALL